MRPVPALLALGLVALAPTAHAAEWVTTVGARVRVKPAYEGAETYVIRPHPTLSIRRAGRPYRFTPADSSGGVGLIDTDRVVAGPLLWFRYRRTDTGAFSGLSPVGLAVEPGGFVDLWPARWLRTRLEVRHGIRGHHGWVGDAGFDLVHSGRRWSASIGPRIGFGDTHYMATYFGVTPAEALASPLIDRAYSPGAGLRYTGATMAGAFRITPRWRTTVDLTYNRLASKALSSPVVQTLGAGHQASIGLGMSYTFGHVS